MNETVKIFPRNKMCQRQNLSRMNEPMAGLQYVCFSYCTHTKLLDDFLPGNKNKINSVRSFKLTKFLPRTQMHPHTHTHTHTNTRTHTNTHARMPMYIYIWIFACVCARVCVCVYVWLRAYVCVCVSLQVGPEAPVTAHILEKGRKTYR